MAAILVLNGTNAGKPSQLVALSVTKKKQKQNPIIYEYHRDISDYRFYKRYTHSDKWAPHFENFSENFFLVFDFIQPKGFGPVRQEL